MIIATILAVAVIHLFVSILRWICQSYCSVQYYDYNDYEGLNAMSDFQHWFCNVPHDLASSYTLTSRNVWAIKKGN